MLHRESENFGKDESTTVLNSESEAFLMVSSKHGSELHIGLISPSSRFCSRNVLVCEDAVV